MRLKVNGIELDDQAGAAPQLAEYAKGKGLRARVFSTGTTYLLVINRTPEFESPSAEEVAAHIDILALQRDFPS